MERGQRQRERGAHLHGKELADGQQGRKGSVGSEDQEGLWVAKERDQEERQGSLVQEETNPEEEGHIACHSLEAHQGLEGSREDRLRERSGHSAGAVEGIHREEIGEVEDHAIAGLVAAAGRVAAWIEERRQVLEVLLGVVVRPVYEVD